MGVCKSLCGGGRAETHDDTNAGMKHHRSYEGSVTMSDMKKPSVLFSSESGVGRHSRGKANSRHKHKKRDHRPASSSADLTGKKASQRTRDQRKKVKLKTTEKPEAGKKNLSYATVTSDLPEPQPRTSQQGSSFLSRGNSCQQTGAGATHCHVEAFSDNCMKAKTTRKEGTSYGGTIVYPKVSNEMVPRINAELNVQGPLSSSQTVSQDVNSPAFIPGKSYGGTRPSLQQSFGCLDFNFDEKQLLKQGRNELAKISFKPKPKPANEIAAPSIRATRNMTRPGVNKNYNDGQTVGCGSGCLPGFKPSATNLPSFGRESAGTTRKAAGRGTSPGSFLPQAKGEETPKERNEYAEIKYVPPPKPVNEIAAPSVEEVKHKPNHLTIKDYNAGQKVGCGSDVATCHRIVIPKDEGSMKASQSLNKREYKPAPMDYISPSRSQGHHHDFVREVRPTSMRTARSHGLSNKT